MARRKVKLADNLSRVVFLEDDATKGATLATDLKDIDGNTLLTPAALRKWLNVAEITPPVAANAIIRGATPASSSAPGSPGQVSYDATYLYICVASATWMRIALSTF